MPLGKFIELVEVHFLRIWLEENNQTLSWSVKYFWERLLITFGSDNYVDEKVLHVYTIRYRYRNKWYDTKTKDTIKDTKIQYRDKCFRKGIWICTHSKIVKWIII